MESSISYGLKHNASLQAKALENKTSKALRQNAYKQLVSDLPANAKLDHYW